MSKKITEDYIQSQIVLDFNNKYCLKHHNPRLMIYAVPNGGSRNVIEAKKLKATGTLRGASDLIVNFPNKVVYIEVKTDVGVQSDAQKDFQSRIEDLGFDYHIVRSLEDFNNKIMQYLKYYNIFVK